MVFLISDNYHDDIDDEDNSYGNVTKRHNGSAVPRLLDDHHPLNPCCLARSLDYRW